MLAFTLISRRDAFKPSYTSLNYKTQYITHLHMITVSRTANVQYSNVKGGISGHVLLDLQMAQWQKQNIQFNSVV